MTVQIEQIQQIHIQAGITDPVLRARHALSDRGDELLADLAAKVELATDLQLPLVIREEVRDGLIDFCAGPLVRHLLATEEVLYTAAAEVPAARLLVRALRALHDLVAVRITELERADCSEQAAVAAHALVGLLEVGQHMERQVLIPALAVLPDLDLPALVDDIGARLAGTCAQPGPSCRPLPDPVLDPLALHG